ncbi:MAG: hypothetical protein ABIR52_13275 [Casimicrobiaceae bacterium]
MLRERVKEIRINAEVVIMPDYEKATVIDASGSSSPVFLPFSLHGGRFFSPFGWEIGDALEHLPFVVLSLAAEDIDLEADPDKPPAEGGNA